MHNGADLHLHKSPGRSPGLDRRVQLALLKLISEPLLEGSGREAEASGAAPGIQASRSRRTPKGDPKKGGVLLSEAHQSREARSNLIFDGLVLGSPVNLSQALLQTFERLLDDGPVKRELVCEMLIEGSDTDLGGPGDRIGIDAI